jgi:hypothetical protein
MQHAMHNDNVVMELAVDLSKQTLLKQLVVHTS